MQNCVIAISDYVTAPAEVEKKVFQNNDFVFLENQDLSQMELENVEVLLVWHQHITKEYLSHFKNLKIIVRYGVGFDNIDHAAVKDAGIVFCNTPDYGTEEVADTACAMIMDASRKISFYDSACRSYPEGTWQENFYSKIKRSNQTTVGIIGVGRIGGAVINRLKGFNFNLLGFDPYVPSGHEKSVGYQRVHELDELLEKSDIISIHCPCNEETEGMVDESFINKMKKHSSLVNTARGKILKSLDVMHAGLKSEQLQSAHLDVLPSEPVDKDHKLIQSWLKREDWLEGRFIINPHSAFYSESAWFEMRYKCAETARLFLEKGMIRNQITI